MKKKPMLLLIAISTAMLFSACSSKSTRYGKKEMSLLGGLVETKKGAYEEIGPLSIGVKKSDINPGAKFKGNRTSFFWGLFVLSDN